jgi:branched-chain amino acid transport system substrate-binding protein
MRWKAPYFLLFVTTLALGGSAAAENSAVKIGIVQATTGGSAALYGIMQKNAAELAVAEINMSGKLGNIKLVARHEDDAGDRGQTVNIFQRLIFQEKVDAILGPTLSNSAFAADPIAQQAHVPVIASSNTAVGITDMGGFIFRTSPAESSVFPGVLRYAQDKFNVKRAAQIYGIDDQLMKSAYNVQKAALDAQKIDIVDVETFQKGDIDYSAQLTKIKSVKPDIIVIGGLAEETANMVRQARQLGIPQNVLIVGANAAISTKLFELAGPAAEGFLVGTTWFAEYDNPLNKAFVAAYESKYHHKPDTFAAQAYVAVYVLADAVKRAGGGSDHDKLREALAATKDLETVVGKFSFTAQRDTSIEPKVLEAKGGRFELVSK